MIILKTQLMIFLRDRNFKNWEMKKIFLLIFIICLCNAESQNIFGDYTALDFISRNSTDMVITKTIIDTVQDKNDETLIHVSYNGKNKRIKIKDENSRSVLYYKTDSLNELIPILKNEEIGLYKLQIFNNGKIIKYAGFYRFYNIDNKLYRMISDTLNFGLANLQEYSLYYSGNVLQRVIIKTYANTLIRSGFKYDVNKPDEVDDITYNGNTERHVYSDFKKNVTYNSVITKGDKKITNRLYYHAKVISITTTIFY